MARRMAISALATPGWANFGAFALGVVLGLIAMVFVFRLEEWTVVGFSAFVGILAAGAVVNFVAAMGGGANALASYAVGLAVGIGAYFLLTAMGWVPQPQP